MHRDALDIHVIPGSYKRPVSADVQEERARRQHERTGPGAIRCEGEPLASLSGTNVVVHPQHAVVSHHEPVVGRKDIGRVLAFPCPTALEARAPVCIAATPEVCFKGVTVSVDVLLRHPQIRPIPADSPNRLPRPPNQFHLVVLAAPKPYSLVGCGDRYVVLPNASGHGGPGPEIPHLRPRDPLAQRGGGRVAQLHPAQRHQLTVEFLRREALDGPVAVSREDQVTVRCTCEAADRQPVVQETVVVHEIPFVVEHGDPLGPDVVDDDPVRARAPVHDLYALEFPWAFAFAAAAPQVLAVLSETLDPEVHLVGQYHAAVVEQRASVDVAEEVFVRPVQHPDRQHRIGR